MSKELRKCENCKHFNHGYCEQPPVIALEATEARNTFCGISAIYFQEKDEIEAQRAMFDRDDTKPKTPPSIFSKENEDCI